eukprot:Seg1600.4 transcript_id=Seg1600.4/GoldUCD/mRNA.D3Y31 product="Metabotropic glutamate receptor 8" protein_id=Seg1600.4/GoldUCD/D3Y31
MKLLVFILFNIICFAETALKEDKNGMFIEENTEQMMLTGFFGAHMQGKTRECGRINGESGIYLIEAMRYAIKNINKKIARFNSTIGFRIYDTCRSFTRLRRQIPEVLLLSKSAGIVGPPTSDEAILASILFGTYNLSVISFSATSVELNDAEKYQHFYRTVPPDDLQAHAMLEILKHYKWKYISTVNSHGNFGQRGMDLLISMLRKEGICISKRNVLPRNPSKQHFDSVVRNLNRDPNARVVVLFTTSEDTKMLLKAAGPKSRFQWLSSSAWKANMQAVQGVNEAAKGAIFLGYVNINDAQFLKHFKNLTLNENRYGWFEEFWEQQFNCTVNEKLNSTKRLCDGNESLQESDFYAKYASGGAVIDAVNAFAYKISCAYEKGIVFSCWNETHCVMDPPLGQLVTKALKSPETCKDIFNDSVKFTLSRNYRRDIAVLNFDGRTYKKIGVWAQGSDSKKSNLNMSDENVIWYHDLSEPPQSICSKPCRIGERTIMSKFKECCFTCETCKRTEILRSNKCVACGEFSEPNQNITKCEKLRKLRITVKHPLSVVVLLESMLGIIFNTIVLYLFIKYKDSRVVKASSRELSIFMLGGLYLCFISPCVFLLDPTKIRCGLRRFIFGISLTACYTPLMLKTNRIYRLFKAARVKIAKPLLVSPGSQIFICFGLLAIQSLLCIMWVVGDKPVVAQLVVYHGSYVADLCGADIITIVVNIIPCFCMMAVSTVYAFKSRKFPKNYNEAASIGVTMYISFVLWAIFIPLLLLVKAESSNPFAQTFVIANFTNIIGLVTLAGLFGPKIRRLFTYADNDTVRMFFHKVSKENLGYENSIQNTEKQGGIKISNGSEEGAGIEVGIADEGTKFCRSNSKRAVTKKDGLTYRSMTF